MQFVYSDQIHRRETIEKLANEFIKSLKDLIIHCQSPESQGYTPSDFDAANVSQEQLDKFMAKIKRN